MGDLLERWTRIPLLLAPLAFAANPLRAETTVSVMLYDIDSGTTSPQGQYRWMDVADQVYDIDAVDGYSYRDSYDYTQASVQIDLFTDALRLHGHVSAANLKPHFAYQFKLAGISGTASNELIGFTGRWWQEEWNGVTWANGQNLNNKGDGSLPSPNDQTYIARRDIPDATSPTGKKYRYTAYLVFDYFLTDDNGDTSFDFEASSSYHVLWKTTQRAHTGQDGPIRAAAFDVELPDPVPAYDTDYPPAAVDIFGEWERLPVGGVPLPPGDYGAEFFLTEESFHGGGLAGGWAAALGSTVTFTLVAIPGDFDGDLDVDQGDLDAFENCALGPMIALVGGCEDKDFDSDNDVDQSDFGVFQRCISGENNPADPNCAD